MDPSFSKLYLCQVMHNRVQDLNSGWRSISWYDNSHSKPAFLQATRDSLNQVTWYQ